MSEEEPEELSSNPANPDPELFYELVSSRTFKIHHISRPYSASTPLYCVQKHESLSSKKPDVMIHRGNSKEGDVLGVLKLGLREHAFGIGDPEALLEEGNVDERVIWERLRRSNKWNHKVYEFEYGSGAGEGGRTKYTWQWTNRGVLGIARDLELRVGSPGEEGEVVALYKKTDWRFIKRGNFFIKKRFSVDGEERQKKWELVVLLTAVGLLEGAVRRS
jgi:hypothetical protein